MIRNKFILSGLLILGACSKAGTVAKPQAPKLDPIEAPPAYELLTQEDVRNFVNLPMRGDVRDKLHYWSGNYWPLNKGNINRRWNAELRIGFNHRSPTPEELVGMTQEKIATLAPTEKYDLLMGAYDYPLRNEVASSVANINAEAWEGIINGWALASTLHQEPLPKVLVNPDGVQIPFGSEDIKALLSYYYAYKESPEITSMVGKPCMNRGCPEDVTAATFHLALANALGLKNENLLMDLDRTRDVWNHPVVAFESEYRGNNDVHAKATPGTYSIVRIKTTVTYIDESLNQSWEAVIGTGNQLETTQVYQYWLHLDREGNIIGGEWKSNERPDFLWQTAAAGPFTGILAGLNQLIDDPAPVITE